MVKAKIETQNSQCMSFFNYGSHSSKELVSTAQEISLFIILNNKQCVVYCQINYLLYWLHLIIFQNQSLSQKQKINYPWTNIQNNLPKYVSVFDLFLVIAEIWTITHIRLGHIRFCLAH